MMGLDPLTRIRDPNVSGRSGASVRQRARPSRQPLRGSPHFVRLGLDRLRSLPHSVAMIDTSVRGRFAPAPPHVPTSTAAHAAMVDFVIGPVNQQNWWLRDSRTWSWDSIRRLHDGTVRSGRVGRGGRQPAQ